MDPADGAFPLLLLQQAAAAKVYDESPEVYEAADKWAQQVQEAKAKGGSKEPRPPPIDPFAPDVDGRSVLVTRFVAPLAPPPGLLDEAAIAAALAAAAGSGPQALMGQRALLRQMKRAARFVSRYPVLQDDQLFVRQDVWTTADEFVYMAAGDDEEHALLLAGIFLHMVGATGGQ